MSIKHLGDVPLDPVHGGTLTTRQVLIGPDEGPNFAMRRFVMEPGGRIVTHTNSVEHQQFVLRGRARIGIGDDVFEAKTGDAILILAGVPHWYEVVGDEPYEFLCVVPNQPDQIELLESVG
ncbi:MAG: cupin domain-containing protein [Candidatus Eiseniibacteriota bacterium]|jgi:quercetin dioxygenase-like cupin family protein